MEKPNCCWNCKYLKSYNPEEDKCELDGHIFEDRFILSAMRDKECPLDISELKGENPDCRNCDKWKTCENGEKGHTNGTSIGYSIGECKDYAELKGENK